MTQTVGPISIKEFSQNVEGFFERVVRENTAVMVENEAGEMVVVKPLARSRKKLGRKKTQADREAFLSSIGSWKDVDVDAFLKANEESRSLSRPPVEL